MDCVKPVLVKTDEGYIEVPCGSCILCRISRTREWATRLRFENTCWSDSVFVTLTYDDEHLPVSNCGYPTLVKKDLQDFFKRLRSWMSTIPAYVEEYFDEDGVLRSRVKFKYFACGEYGDNGTQRCHFHFIGFGLGPSSLADLQRCWDKGFVSVGGVTPESINYVTGYVRKKVVKKDKSPEGFSCLHRAPEFQIQSQGLGYKFYEQYRDRFLRTFSVTLDGHRQSIPRYFLKKDDVLRNSMKASQRVFDIRSENLKEAQRILDKRNEGKCILDLQRESSLQKARTEYSKNALFRKGKV